MKLYLISQDVVRGYDRYDSAVVVAPDEETARRMSPDSGKSIEESNNRFPSWCSNPRDVDVKYLGEAVDCELGVVCASYNAG